MFFYMMDVRYGACLIHLVPNLERDNCLFVTFLPKIMKLHQKFLKYILGVHTKTTNIAVLSEISFVL
jgi:hypothetical protein